MLNPVLVFALLAGVSAGSYAIFQKLGSTSINPPFGAMIVSVVAFTVNLFILVVMKLKGQEILVTSKGLLLLVFVGLAAAGIDFLVYLLFQKA